MALLFIPGNPIWVLNLEEKECLPGDCLSSPRCSVDQVIDCPSPPCYPNMFGCFSRWPEEALPGDPRPNPRPRQDAVHEGHAGNCPDVHAAQRPAGRRKLARRCLSTMFARSLASSSSSVSIATRDHAHQVKIFDSLHSLGPRDWSAPLSVQSPTCSSAHPQMVKGGGGEAGWGNTVPITTSGVGG